jgi:hypothetical protein
MVLEMKYADGWTNMVSISVQGDIIIVIVGRNYLRWGMPVNNTEIPKNYTLQRYYFL